jgi:molybdopterin converting factor small subunit
VKMVVTIKFIGMQRIVTNKESIEMPISGNDSVKDALGYVRRHYPDLFLEEEMVLVHVNHEITCLDRILMPNDTISFLPVIAGG